MQPTSILEFPFGISAASFAGRFGVFVRPQYGALTLDFKGSASSAQIVSVIPTAASAVSIFENRIALGHSTGVQVVDLSGKAVADLSNSTIPRAKSVAALDWSDERLLAAGSLAGTVALWDLRSGASPCFHGFGISFATSQLAFNRIGGFDATAGFLASVHADTVLVWDLRALSTPLVCASGKGMVDSLTWTGGSELFFTSSSIVWRVHTLEQPFAEPVDSGCQGVLALRGLGGDTLLAQQCGREVHLQSAGSDLRSVGTVEFGMDGVKNLAYLDDLRLLVGWEKNFVLFSSVASWCDSEHSPRMHAIASYSSVEVDELKPIRLAVAKIARTLRRLHFDVTEDLDVSIGEGEGSGFVLRVSLQLEVGAVSWDVWWVGESNFAPPLPTTQIEEITLHQILHEPTSVLHTFRQLRDELAGGDADASTPSSHSDDAHISPFPPTCGICWSPRGDLFRFNSLRGMAPFPVFRERLTMGNFLRLAQGPTTTGEESIAMNDFSKYIEPPEFAHSPDELERDAEFDRRVLIDVCVQFVPSSVFEETVEDHWFSSIGVAVTIDSNPQVTCKSLAEHVRTCFPANRLVLETWECAERLFGITGAHQVVVEKIFLEKLKQAYLAEQTQTVALLGALALRAGYNIDPLPQLLLVMHDHANFFQRLRCPQSARFLTKVLCAHSGSRFPLPFEPDHLAFGDSPGICSWCSLPVRGLGQWCVKCGLGGHLAHARRRSCLCEEN